MANLPYEFIAETNLINADLIILTDKFIINEKHRKTLTPKIKKASDKGSVVVVFTGENRDDILLKEVSSGYDLCMGFRHENEFEYSKYGGQKTILGIHMAWQLIQISKKIDCYYQRKVTVKK